MAITRAQAEGRICPFCEGPCTGCGMWADDKYLLALDFVGRESWPRYRCFLCGVEVVRREWMNEEEWMEARDSFIAKHEAPRHSEEFKHEQ
jgi:hypothetical protein